MLAHIIYVNINIAAVMLLLNIQEFRSNQFFGVGAFELLRGTSK
ncbi:Uncharacterised protein [Vibrio cholerae]|nr:Uncharacterised protein [Vibrio cholerae]